MKIYYSLRKVLVIKLAILTCWLGTENVRLGGSGNTNTKTRWWNIMKEQSVVDDKKSYFGKGQ